jgi:hypothetical protein
MVNAIESEKNFSVEGDLLIENSSFRDVAFDYSSKQKVTLYLVFVVCTAVISSFTFGYSLGAPNISENIIRDCQKDPAGFSLPPCIPMNSAQWGFVIGLFPIGGLVVLLKFNQRAGSLEVGAAKYLVERNHYCYIMFYF